MYIAHKSWREISLSFGLVFFPPFLLQTKQKRGHLLRKGRHASRVGAKQNNSEKESRAEAVFVSTHKRTENRRGLF